MTADEQKKYLMTDTKTEKLNEKGEKYDSDLDRTMYQEYWSYLKNFKEHYKRSQSVVKEKMSRNINFTPV